MSNLLVVLTTATEAAECRCIADEEIIIIPP